MRNKIFGAIGILWGGGIVGHRLIAGPSTLGTSAYQNGQSLAVLLGAAMLAAGLYYFFKKSK
jgi:LPXTG-motif cell wall-anchored protein